MLNRIVFLLIATLFCYTSLAQTSLTSTRVYAIQDCDDSQFQTPGANCFAFLCIDDTGYSQIVIGYRYLVAGRVVSGNDWSGISVFGFTESTLNNAAKANATWTFSGNNVTINFEYFYEDNNLYDPTNTSLVSQVNLTLVEERPFESSLESCLWYPESTGYFDGKFGLTIPGVGTATFDGCGITANDLDYFFGQSYLQIPQGFITVHLYSNISGYVRTYENRRFYYGFIHFAQSSFNSGTCGNPSPPIPFPFVNPLFMTVDNNATNPSIDGFTIFPTLESKQGDEVLVPVPLQTPNGGPLDHPIHCRESSQYRTKCLGLPGTPTSSSTFTTAEPTTSSTFTTEETSSTSTPEETTVETETENSNGMQLLVCSLFSLLLLL